MLASVKGSHYTIILMIINQFNWNNRLFDVRCLVFIWHVFTFQTLSGSANLRIRKINKNNYRLSDPAFSAHACHVVQANGNMLLSASNHYIVSLGLFRI